MTFSRARLVRALVAAFAATLVSAPAWVPAPAAAVDTPTAATADAALRVGTFNVRCANCSKNPVNSREKSWSVRGPVVAQSIVDERLDVIGLQEASPGLLSGTKIAQFENLLDLVNERGGSYAVTNAARYNCTRTSTTFSSCGGYLNRGASQDARIFYNTQRLSLEDNGSLRLDGRSIGNGSARYMAWAQFSDRVTGKQFIFATAHFEPGVSKSKTSVRVKQVKKAIAELNRVNDGLPIIWGSDLASSKLTHVGNKAYDAFRAAGFTDPLGNTYKSKVIPTSADLTPSTAVNEEYFTLNNFASGPKDYVSRGYKLGAHLDYILVKGNVRTTAWKEVMNLDSGGKFAGVIPSDHNMVVASVALA